MAACAVEPRTEQNPARSEVEREFPHIVVRMRGFHDRCIGGRDGSYGW